MTSSAVWAVSSLTPRQASRKKRAYRRAQNGEVGSAARAAATRYGNRDYVRRGTADVATIRTWLRHPVK